MNRLNHIIETHGYLILFITGLILAFVLLYLTSTYLWPFLLGLALAYLLLPLIKLLDRILPFHQWHRGRRSAIVILIFFLIVGLIILLTFLAVSAIVAASSNLFADSPDIIGKFMKQLQTWTDDIRALVPESIRTGLDTTFLGTGTDIGQTVGAVISNGLSGFLSSAIKVIIGLAVVPVFLFYLLKDNEKLSCGFYAACSPRTGRHIRNTIGIIEKVLGRFIRAEITLSLVVGGACLIGLLALGAPFALPLAFIAGVGEIVPMIGPWVSGAIAVLVMIALAPEKALWVALLYLGVQLMENTLLVPRIQGGYMHIHPAIAIILLFIGGYLFGFLGIVLIIPLTATAVELTKYFNNVWKSEDNRLVSKSQVPIVLDKE